MKPTSNQARWNLDRSAEWERQASGLLGLPPDLVDEYKSAFDALTVAGLKVAKFSDAQEAKSNSSAR